MRPLSSLAVSSLALLQSVATGSAPPSSDVQIRHKSRSANVQIQEEIASIICPNSTIISPNDANWTTETERFMQNVKPQVQVLVRPGCESDVERIVQYANSYNISFYAVSRGHAFSTSVGQFSGIEIDLRNLNSIHINPDNTTAHFQGGSYGYEVVPYLWEQGYVTASGGCECVSMLGPALGGGHTLQQGKHGLTMDHFVNLNVVLANGTAIGVNANSHPDIWWAMRGAGHNFGIVTSFDSKIWPDNFKEYYVRTYQFAGSSLDTLFEQVNKFQGNGTLNPVWLATFGSYSMNATLSKTEATITWVFLHDGPLSADAKAALKPFDQLSPLSVSEVNVGYNVIFGQLGGSLNGALCEPNKTHIVGTAYLQVYNITTMRAIYDLYNQKIRQNPRLGGTRVAMEGYGMQGVKSFKSSDSAYPFRSENILLAFDGTFDTTDDPAIDFSKEWRDQTVDLWNSGQPGRKPTAYVNYAAGYESLEARYGHEPWRLERLRKLKSQYDPNNRFAWYNPIVPPQQGY